MHRGQGERSAKGEAQLVLLIVEVLLRLLLPMRQMLTKSCCSYSSRIIAGVAGSGPFAVQI